MVMFIVIKHQKFFVMCNQEGALATFFRNTGAILLLVNGSGTEPENATRKKVTQYI
jgi:hypothetical protein